MILSYLGINITEGRQAHIDILADSHSSYLRLDKLELEIPTTGNQDYS
jgi:hypothetical protein